MIDTMQTDKARRPRERAECSGPVVQWPGMRSGGQPSMPETFGRMNFGTPGAGSQAQLNARRKIEKVLAYMLQHLDRSLPVPTLSAMAGLSTSNFYLLFKLGTGSTPNDLHIRARMSRACVLLRETDLSVKEVANQLGYDDQFYFSRLFKLVKGLPPRAYRARMARMPGSSQTQVFDLAENKQSELELFLSGYNMNH
jgi:AraC-like DNA-binding protein